MKHDVEEAIPAVFPLDAVVKALDGWWQQEQADSALPGDPPATSDIMQPSIEIDSHRAVRALITIQEVVKFEIPESAIKEGGYDGIEEMREHLIPRIEALFDKKRKKQNA